MASPLIVVPQQKPEARDAGIDRVADALRDFYLRSHRLMDRIMTARGASFARSRLLTYIAREGPTRSIDLASSFGYAPRTVTEAIDGMERDGLVMRHPDPDDRRAKRISLTAAGAAAAEAAEVSKREYLSSVFTVIDPQERDEIVRLIGKLNDRLADLED
jgi:DNA-binding MarR family transcriptional regulator